jgi:hypothetical protein
VNGHSDCDYSENNYFSVAGDADKCSGIIYIIMVMVF